MIRHRLEAWTRDGSKRQAIFGTLYRAERRQVLQGEEVLNAEVSAQDPALDHLSTGSVLRLQREGVATDATLWRLTGRGKTRDASNALRYQITADALWMDLRQGMVRQRLIDGRSQYTFGLNGLTPAQWLEDFILPGYEGTAVGFQLGVVEISDPVDLSFERTNPLAALRMLEGAADAEAQFRLDPSGEFYWVDLLERVGSTQGTAELRYGKNLVGLERLEDETDVETRLYAVGSGLLTLADAEWRIGSLSGPTSARVITFDGPSPVFEDGAFVGLWLSVAGKGLYPITASDAETGTITVDATDLPALAVGDVGHLVTDEEGTRLDHLESPEGVADYGVRVGTYVADDVPDAVNAIPNSDLSDWTNGLPTGWTTTGDPVVTEETDRLYVHQGERAARVEAGEANAGLLSPSFTISNPVDRPYTALLAGLTLISGSVRLELRRQGGETYPIGERPVLIDLGVYSTMSAGPVHDEPLPAGTYQVAVIAHGAAAEWVLDCAMVTPVIGEEVPAYVAGSGAHLLWERTAAELAERRLPRVEYRVDVADLYRVDPAAFRFDELRLGDSVKLRDPEFPRETTRIVELTQDVLDARATQVVLADSARMRVHDPFRPPNPALGGRRAGIGRRSTGTEGAAVLAVQRQWDPTTGLLTIGAIGSAVTATLELRTRTSPDDPWVLADTIAGRQGWFDPIEATDSLLYQVTPLDGRGVPGEAVEDSWARGSEGPQGPPGPKGEDGEPGAPATAYWLVTDVAAIRRSDTGDYTPASITASARSATGTAAPAPYAGRFQIATLAGTTWTTRYTSPSDEATYEYGPLPAGVDAVRVRLYLAGGTTTLLDEETVPVVEDGKDGDEGPPGTDYLPPVCTVTQVAFDLYAHFLVEGRDWQGGTSGLEYRWVWHYADEAQPAWGDWDPLPSGEATVQVEIHPGRGIVVVAEVRDAEGRVSPTAWHSVPPMLPAMDPTTGRILRTVPLADDELIETQSGATAKASVAEAAAKEYADQVAGQAEAAAKEYANIVIRSGAEPTTRPDSTPLRAGDIWLDSSDGDLPHTWTGTNWRRMYTSINGGDIKTGTVDADQIATKAVTAEKLDVDELSAVTADLGEVTAGVIRGADDGLVVDADERLITVRDQQSTPVERVRMGRLGAGADDYGLQIRDRHGGLILDASGNMGRAVNVPKHARIVEAYNGMEWSYAGLFEEPPEVIAHIGGGILHEGRDRWGALAQSYEPIGVGSGTGSDPAPSGKFALIPRFSGEVLEATQQIRFHAYLMTLRDPVTVQALLGPPAAEAPGESTGSASPSAADLPSLGDTYTAYYAVSAKWEYILNGQYMLAFHVDLEVTTDNGNTWTSVGSKWTPLTGFHGPIAAPEVRHDQITVTRSGLEGSDVAWRLYFRALQITAGPPDESGLTVSVEGDLVRWQRDANVLYASATPTEQSRALFLVMAQR